MKAAVSRAGTFLFVSTWRTIFVHHKISTGLLLVYSLYCILPIRPFVNKMQLWNTDCVASRFCVLLRIRRYSYRPDTHLTYRPTSCWRYADHDALPHVARVAYRQEFSRPIITNFVVWRFRCGWGACQVGVRVNLVFSLSNNMEACLIRGKAKL